MKMKEKQIIRQLKSRILALEIENYKLKEWQDYYKGKAEALASVINAAESIHFREKKDESRNNKSDT